MVMYEESEVVAKNMPVADMGYFMDTYWHDYRDNTTISNPAIDFEHGISEKLKISSGDWNCGSIPILGVRFWGYPGKHHYPVKFSLGREPGKP